MYHKTAWNWTDDNANYLVRVRQDSIEWACQTCDQDRRTCFQSIDEFLQIGIPGGFAPSAEIVTELTAFLESGIWKTIPQYETLWVHLHRTEPGRFDVIVTHYKGHPEIRRHEAVDRTFIDYYLHNLKRDGWRETHRDRDRHYFQRKWRYQEEMAH